jgi:hypothetical protein
MPQKERREDQFTVQRSEKTGWDEIEDYNLIFSSLRLSVPAVLPRKLVVFRLHDRRDRSQQ